MGSSRWYWSWQSRRGEWLEAVPSPPRPLIRPRVSEFPPRLEHSLTEAGFEPVTSMFVVPDAGQLFRACCGSPTMETSTESGRSEVPGRSPDEAA